GRLWSPEVAARLGQILAGEAYDAVQLEGFEVAGYLLGPCALRADAQERAPWSSPPALVFDDHNAEHRLQPSPARRAAAPRGRWPKALYPAVQARRLRAREALYAAGADVCLAVSLE